MGKPPCLDVVPSDPGKHRKVPGETWLAGLVLLLALWLVAAEAAMSGGQRRDPKKTRQAHPLRDRA